MTRFVLETDLGARRSSVLHEETGTREVAEFYGPDGSFLSGITTIGKIQPTAALLICNSLHAEGLKNHRRETLLARRVATLGIASHRFDYRGAGNSSGQVCDMTVDSIVDDMLTAAHHLAERTSGLPLGIVATRMAAIPLARAMGRLEASAVALWQPIVDYPRFFKELERNKGIQDRAEGLRAEKEGRPIEERLTISDQFEKAGQADVTGSTYGRALHESYSEVDVGGEFGSYSGPVQIIQISQREKIQKPLDTFAESLRARHVETQLDVVAGEEENWWFRTGVQGFQTEEDRRLNRSVLDLTSSFLTTHLQGGQ